MDYEELKSQTLEAECAKIAKKVFNIKEEAFEEPNSDTISFENNNFPLRRAKTDCDTVNTFNLTQNTRMEEENTISTLNRFGKPA